MVLPLFKKAKNSIMRKLILASGSPRRKELLEKAGLQFEIVKSDYEEDMTLDLPPHELVEHLSLGKALDVAKKFNDAVVISADTIVVLDGEILGKPHTPENATEMLKKLNGKKHSVFTGFTIIDIENNKTVTRSVETFVFFKNNAEAEIDAYVETGEPLDKAGAYAIQGLGGRLIERIEGSLSNVIGLPVEELMGKLKELGIEDWKEAH